MSMNHICKNGLADIDLTVKDIECTTINSTTINATTINVEGTPIQSFDQDLNTTDDVAFNKITLGATIFTDPQQVVNKAYVDNSSPGLGSLQVAYDGGNTILTQAGFPIEISGQEGVIVTKTTFANDQDLVTKKFVDDSISSIPPPNTTLQNAYDNGTGDIALSTSKPLNITGTAGVNLNANSITTAKLTFNNSQELVSRQYVDDKTQLFTGATPLTNGTEGLVPAPTANQIYHNLMSDGFWLRVAPPEYVRNYGSVILDWQSYDNPSTKNINVAGNSFYSTSDNKNFYISLINGQSQTGYINFDAGQQFSKFQFTISYRIPTTTQPADTLSFFVNGTQLNTGGENQTGGNTFVTDYYSNAQFFMKSKFIKDDGTDLTAFQTDGYLPVTDHYNIMTITGFDNNLTVEIRGDSGRYYRSAQFSTNGTGTRFGIHGRTGSSLMEVQINSIQLIAV